MVPSNLLRELVKPPIDMVNPSIKGKNFKKNKESTAKIESEAKL